jgi:hypothetical protein
VLLGIFHAVDGVMDSESGALWRICFPNGQVVYLIDFPSYLHVFWNINLSPRWLNGVSYRSRCGDSHQDCLVPTIVRALGWTVRMSFYLSHLALFD